MVKFESIEKDGIQIIICPKHIEVADSAMEAEVKKWLLSTAPLHILDFKNTVEIRPQAYRAFVIYNQTLKAYKKHLYCINLSTALLAQIRADGLTSVFHWVPSIQEAKKRVNPAGKFNLDVEFVNPFISAAKNVLEIQAQMKITPGKSFIRKQDERLPMEIAGVMAMTAREFTGAISICFRKNVFLNIYEKLTGEKHEEINSEVEDAAAEILNIIFGQAKTELNDKKGYKIERAMPSVLTGDKLRLHHSSRNPTIVIPFESPEGAFHIEILVDKN